MTVAQAQRLTFAEFYVVKTENLPTLFAWEPAINSSKTQSVGWKMAYRLRHMYGGHWIWAEERLVTDQQVTAKQMQDALEVFWGKQDSDFSRVVDIKEDEPWKPAVLTIAEFVAVGLAADENKAIWAILRNYKRSIPRAMIEREHYIRGWDMSGVPVISVSVSSSITSTVDFPQQVQRLNETNQDRVLDLFVRDTTSDMKGEIIAVVGKLQDHRQRLTKLTARAKMREKIQNALDNDLVVKIKSGNNEYDYITSVLQIVVRTRDYKRLQIDGQQALKNLQLDPDVRSQMTQEIANVLAQRGYIYPDPVSDVDQPEHFVSMSSLGVNSSVRLGDGRTCRADARTILSELKRHPMYRRAAALEDNAPLKIGVLNFIGEDTRIQSYLHDIRSQLRDIRFDVEFTSAERPDADSQYQIESSIDRLTGENPNIVMVFAPGSPTDADDNEDNLYNMVKAYTTGRGIQSQFIYERTLDKSYALANIILGIVAKTGNVPYVLDKPLPYTDIVAGIDVARIATKRRSGSMSIPAVTRIYTTDGDFLRYILSESPIEGETLPKATLRRLFPAELFAEKRVLVHRDGPFRGDEMQHLYEWGDEIGSDFQLVEVIKSGSPRIYADRGSVQRPNKGDAVILNAHEAILVSSLPPHKNSTPRPLQVRTDGKLTIEEALNSILSLTLMHFGSALQPRLPVTIHYSDRIGYLALQGIKPRNAEGTKPYWL